MQNRQQRSGYTPKRNKDKISRPKATTGSSSERGTNASKSRPQHTGRNLKPGNAQSVKAPSKWSGKSHPKANRGAKPTRNQPGEANDLVRLNRYIANAGVCSRREADVLITTGAITVNGRIVSELGTRVEPGDKVMYGSQRLINEKKVYLLLNKPKDYITTSEDPRERKTVFELIRHACRERLHPVGRLDRNTTGLLLFTNDGDLTKKLTHPRHGIRKLYHAVLDKALTKNHLQAISEGVKLDETFIRPDSIAYASELKKDIGIEIHSGQNRVVRRIFEHFGYKVTKLDRVVFAGLTKKDLPRGKWRFLTDKEVSFLKMLG